MRRRALGQTTEDVAQDASRTLTAGSGGPEKARVAPSATHGRQKRVRPPYWPPGVDSELEMRLYTRLERAGLPLGVGQHRFIEGRQHRFDRAYPEQKVAVEVQGGSWSQNGHARPSIVQRDCLKLSMAAAFGWRCLPVTEAMIDDGTAIRLIKQALEV